MIELKELQTGYGKNPDVLENINLTVRDGKVTVLLGPNGCGKSTLLKAAAGILPITGGQIFVDGIPSAELSPRQLARRISYMPQSRNTPNILAERMILHGRFPYLSYPRHYSREDMEIARKATIAADAEDVAKNMMPELSGGQRQKVYLAMTLAQDTQTVLMDEPMSFLDIGHQLSLMDMAHSLANQGKAVLLVMHDIPLSLQSADEIALMESGRVVFQGTGNEACSSGEIDRVFGVRLKKMETEAGERYFFL